MKRFLIICLLIISNFCHSQNSQETIVEKKWIIKINASQLIDVFSFPTLAISGERKINNWFSVNAEFGYQIHKTETIADTTFLDQKGFKANLEGRIYFKNFFNPDKKFRHKPYVGLQAFYRQNQKSNSITYHHISDPAEQEVVYDDDFGVKKKIIGVNLTFGCQFSPGRRFIMEPFLALGLMNRKLENVELQYDKNKHNSDENHGFLLGFDIDDKDSKDIINFGMGFRLGYKF